MMKRHLFPCVGYGFSHPARPRTTLITISSGNQTVAHLL